MWYFDRPMKDKKYHFSMSVLHVSQIVKMETNRANHLSSQKSEKKSYYSRESTTFEK